MFTRAASRFASMAALNGGEFGAGDVTADTIPDIEARDFWDSDTRVVEIIGRRHRIQVRGGPGEPWGDTVKMTCCNRCGCALVRRPENVCPVCLAPQEAGSVGNA